MGAPKSITAKGYDVHFWERFDFDGPEFQELGPCWEWKGGKSKSEYGIAWVCGENFVSHKLAYEEIIGRVPDGLELDHLCRNRPCGNPFHLEAVTHFENCRRGETPVSKNMALTACSKCGDEFDIDTRGRRVCRPCARARASRHYYEKARPVFLAGQHIDRFIKLPGVEKHG